MSTIRQRAYATAATGIAAFALAACGGGAGGGHAAGLSKRELLRRAQLICLRAQAAAGNLLPPATRAGLVGYFGQTAAIAARRTQQLQALIPDGEAAGAWDRVISAEVVFNARMQTIRQAASSGDAARLRLAEADTRPEQTLIASATRFGAALCAH